ncbi:MAG: endolytic transglycosylase MltG, partial [Rhodothermales bacterium]
MRRKLGFVLLAVLGIAALVGIIGFWITFGPNTRIYSGERSLKVPPGSGFEAVVDSLQSSGILQSRDTYSLVSRLTGWGGQIKAGHYVFASGVSNYDILNKLRKGLQEPIHLTIPPGTRPEVVAAVAGREMYFSSEDFLSGLTGVAGEMGTETQHLFGHMLPETYFVYWLTDAKSTVARIVQQFDAFYEEELRSRADSLGLSKDEIVTLASIIEWETGREEEKATVAG